MSISLSDFFSAPLSDDDLRRMADHIRDPFCDWASLVPLFQSECTTRISGGATLPAGVREVYARVVGGELRRPRGRDYRGKNTMRDLTVHALVVAARYMGYPMTRGSRDGGATAFECAQEYLRAHHGVDMSAERVERIYYRVKKNWISD